MPEEMRSERRRYRKVLRMLAIITVFMSLTHLNRGEGSRIEDPTEMNRFFEETRAQNFFAEPMDFEATAYSITGITKSGIPVAPGHVAADPDVIPLGSIIYVDAPMMSGVYHVLDTGSLIKGNIIDIYIPSYEEAIEFGRRKVTVTVLRHGFPQQIP